MLETFEESKNIDKSRAENLLQKAKERLGDKSADLKEQINRLKEQNRISVLIKK